MQTVSDTLATLNLIATHPYHHEVRLLVTDVQYSTAVVRARVRTMLPSQQLLWLQHAARLCNGKRQWVRQPEERSLDDAQQGLCGVGLRYNRQMQAMSASCRQQFMGW